MVTKSLWRPASNRSVTFFLFQVIMAKRKSDSEVQLPTKSTVTDYVINVIPKKPHQNYDRFMSQTSPSTVKSTVCLDESKMKAISELKDSGSPVKILNIKRNDDTKRSRYLSEIIISPMSMITEDDKAEVHFQLQDVEAPTYVKIKGIENLQDWTVVNVKGKLHGSLSGVVDQSCKDGSIKQMLEGALFYDETGCIYMTLWEDATTIVSEAGLSSHNIPCLTFDKVKVKVFIGSTYLSTTTETVISTCNESSLIDLRLPDRKVNAAEALDNISVDKIALVSNYSWFYVCQTCRKKLTDVSTIQNVRCSTCSTGQRIADCSTTFNIKIKPSDSSSWYTMFERVLRREFPDLEDSINSEMLSELLLSLENIKMIVDKKTNVVKEIRRESVEVENAKNEEDANKENE